MHLGFRALLVLLALLSAGPVMAETRVAVASNFYPTAQILIKAHEQNSGERITLSVGSSGKHFAQIMNGAPFDALLSADAERPERLESAGRAVEGSRFTYAIGRLVLWSPDPEQVDAAGAVLSGDQYRKLAIANPKLAPYGLAAEQTLHALGLYGHVQHRLVRGENINQAFHFVVSGNAELGLLAASQVIDQPRGSQWAVPAHLHDTVEQQAVLLSNSEEAANFLAFLVSPEGRSIIQDQGYGLADVERH